MKSIDRRSFIFQSTFATIGLACSIGCLDQKANFSHKGSNEYLELCGALLKEWCDAMIKVQIDNPSELSVHGALMCPACNKIHGRCMDAVYPFIHLAAKTGEDKYLKAAIDVMKWSKNVSKPDGSWTVIPNPKSWNGISVFGGIALAETLKHHANIVPANVHDEWFSRLQRVGQFIFENFSMTYSHINYGFSAVYALHLIGNVLNVPKYIDRSRELAKEIPEWFTPENQLLFGEDKPSDKRSVKGLLPVDLGYNVEESLNGVVLYALAEKDEALLQLLEKSMHSHLEFMLPDGGWDNSWGTRQNKWSYWGSRTTDGCQPAFTMMAGRNPVFGTAAFKNLQLLKKCTVNGLLAGGLHYESAGILPCVHHSFAHAKSLAFILDHQESIPIISEETALPRSAAQEIKHFQEIDVWLSANGPWRFTVSSYDNVFKTKGSNQATGGSLSLLYHEKVGLLFAASMVKYILAEKNNQQPQPGEEFATTPRLEAFKDGKWFTNLYDLEAKVTSIQEANNTIFNIETNLVDETRTSLELDQIFKIQYQTNGDYFEISVNRVPGNCTLVLPLISPSNESYDLADSNTFAIRKPQGNVMVKSDKEMTIKAMQKERIFNMVPGIEVIPVLLHLKKGESTKVKIEVL